MIALVGILLGLLLVAIYAAVRWRQVALEYKHVLERIAGDVPRAVKHEPVMRTFNGMPAIIECACGYRPSPGPLDPEDAVTTHIAMHRAAARQKGSS